MNEILKIIITGLIEQRGALVKALIEINENEPQFEAKRQALSQEVGAIDFKIQNEMSIFTMHPYNEPKK